MMAAVKRVGVLIAGTVPLVSILLLSMLQFLPYGIPHFQAVTPNLFLAGAFYWALNRPDLAPEWLLFCLGLVYDLLAGGILGLTAMAVVVMARFITDQRRVLAGRMFILSWFGFIIVGFAYALAAWLVTALATDGAPPAMAAAMQALMTMAAYPVVARLLGNVHRWVLD